MKIANLIKSFTFALIANMFLVSPFIAYAGDWEQREDGIYYINDEYTNERWVKKYGYWYYVDETGKMVTGKMAGGFEFNEGQYDEIPIGALIEENQVLSTEREVDGINYLEICRGFDSPDKIVIMLHALGNDKEELRDYGCYLASIGHMVLIPDLYAHNDPYTEATCPEIIENTAYSIDMLLDYYCIDTEKDSVSIIGDSFGGMIGGYYVSNGDYDIDKLAMLMSTLDFQSLENEMYLYSYHNGEQEELQDREEIQAKLSAMSPMNDLSAFADTKILMINDGKDQYIPYKSVKESTEKIKKNAALKTKTTNYKKHMVTEKEIMECINFVDK